MENNIPLFLMLPSEVLHHIVHSLEFDDALNFARSRTTAGRVRFEIHPISRLSALYWVGRYLDGHIPRLHQPQIEIPCPISRIHSILVSCQWVDQGWGNRKGSLFIVGTPKLDESTADVVPLPVDVLFHGGRVVVRTMTCAEHHWTKVELRFQPRDDENYHLWFEVGAGGGHELRV